MDTHEERWSTLEQLDDWLRTPMLVLSLVWLVLVVIELVWGGTRVLNVLGIVIWGVFVAEFALRFTLAPAKVRFLRGNWITVLSLLAPALRAFPALRLFRAARAMRGLRLVRIVGTANRSMNALRAGLRRRGFGYLAGLTVMVALLGAGGMLVFEPASEVQGGFTGYADALWWTVMLVATMGSQFWPVTAEGRVLCILLASYGFAVFGYITATFASYFVGRDAASDGDGGSDGGIAALRREIAALRAELRDHPS